MATKDGVRFGAALTGVAVTIVMILTSDYLAIDLGVILLASFIVIMVVSLVESI